MSTKQNLASPFIGKKPCGNVKCGISTAVDEVTLTFGTGKLDNQGFWEKPCSVCARAWETDHPEWAGKCWPR